MSVLKKEKSSSIWIVYIIETKSGKLYTGITTNLERRLKAHKTGKKGARFFNFSSPERVLFSQVHPNRSEASKREAAIKKMNRQTKLDLCANWVEKN